MVRPLISIITSSVLIICSMAQAQQGQIEGKVTDQRGIPVSNVEVSLENVGLLYSNDEGYFNFSELDSGSYTLKFFIENFAPEERRIKLAKGENMTLLPVKLMKVKELDEVSISTNRDRFLEKNVSSSLRLQTPIQKLPQNIQIVNNNLLKNQQVTSIMDGVIRNVSGVTMLEHWGHFARINMRGFRIPAFRNGFNVNDSWGPLSDDMSFVDQIEFVKGPSGFMLAAGEPGGFYNVVTKQPTTKSIADLNVMVGNYDFYRGSVDLGGKIIKNSKLFYRFNGYYQTTDSHRGNEDVQRFGLAPALTYQMSEKTALTAELNYQNAESSIGSAYVFAPVSAGYGSLDRNFKMTDTNYPLTNINETTVYTTLTHQIASNWQGTLRYAHLTYNQEGNSAWISTVEDNGDAYRSIFKWDALSQGNYAQAYVNGKAKTGSISHTILSGFDYTDKTYWADFGESYTDTVPFNIYDPAYGTLGELNFDRSEDVEDRSDNPYSGFESNGIYIQDEIGFFKNKIRITLAGRYTHIATEEKEEIDRRFTPRIGTSIDLTNNTTVYGLFDQSFLPQAGIGANGEFFDPVIANDIEGGLKKTFLNKKVQTSVSVYRITKNNMLVGDPENPNFSIQLGEVQSQGVEFDLQGEIVRGLDAVINYAHTNVEITDDPDEEMIGTKVAGHAKHVTNAWFTYRFAKKSIAKGFAFSLGYQYQIDRSTWTWAADNQTDLPDYFRLDGGVSWTKNKLRLQLNVNNILNEYLYSGANYGSYLYWQSEPGVNGRFSISYSIL